MSDRSYDPVPIGKVLDGQTQRFGMGGAKQVGELFAAWARIVGPAVAEHVEPTSLRNGTLKLVADSPTWATEIKYLREEIRAQANAALGSDVIQKIEVAAGARRTDAARRDSPAPRERSEQHEERPPTDDPLTAFERAHAAWQKRRSRRS